MLKRLVWMIFYQIVVLFIMIFEGDMLIPEDSEHFPRNENGMVFPGMLITQDGKELYAKYQKVNLNLNPRHTDHQDILHLSSILL
jgi:hypothetical protein